MTIQTPDQRVRVFVSSTMRELADERGAVKAAVKRLHLTPVLFEMGARPHPPRDLYLAYLQQSHVFIGIYWQQYGWIAPGENVSGIEDEYVAAGHLPKLVYLRAPAPERDPRLAAMIERIRDDGLSYRSFSDAHELAALVSDDLAVLLSERFANHTQAPEADQRPRQWHLPAATSSFIGRRQELLELQDLLVDPSTRLITLAGPGGIGKTRLALEVAASGADTFTDGVAAVMLAPVRSPDLVPAAIMSTLGVPESFGRSPVDALEEYLKSRGMLLLLDNVEHVIDAAPVVAELLAAADRLKVLATSREILHLRGEHVYGVPPLDVPGRGEDADEVAHTEAVELFLDRARAVLADLRVDEEQLRVIAEICRRLDGLPLAIELAAARVRMLEPAEILRRLDRRLGILTGGARDLPVRLRTLRQAIQWSYDLLDDRDACLFERLAVFTGGFSIDAAEAVCLDEKVPDVLEGIASLLDKSLVRAINPVDGVPRFTMLETIREFALERLEASGDLDRVQTAHAAYFLRLAVDTGPGYRTGEEQRLVELHDAEHGNLRAAMRWSVDHGEPEHVIAMALGLWQYWWGRSHFLEGMSWMDEVLADPSSLTPEQETDARFVLGILAFGHGDYERAAPRIEQGWRGYREQDRRLETAIASIPMGFIRAFLGREDGEPLLEQAVADLRGMDDPWGLTFALFSLGRIRMARGAYAEAVPLLDEASDRARALGTGILLSYAVLNLGWAHLGLGELDKARPPLCESLERAAAVDNRQNMARSFEALAALALAGGDAGKGARLFGAAEGVRRSIGALVWPPDLVTHAQTGDALRRALGDEAYAETFDEGLTLAIPQALALASDI